MRTITLFAALFFSAIAPLYAKAFKCEVKGQTVYQSKPCDNGNVKVFLSKEDKKAIKQEKIRKAKEEEERKKAQEEAAQLQREKAELEAQRKAQIKAQKEMEAKVKQERKKLADALVATGKVSYSTIEEYSETTYPKLVSRFKARLADVDIYRLKAAKMALDSGKCDSIDIVELSTMKSALNNLVFWVYCKNKRKIYLSESEIDTNTPVFTTEETSWSESRALRECQRLIKSSASIPSSVDISILFGTSVFKSPLSHNVRVRMNFDARNAIGMEIPYTANCYFAPGESGSIEIYRR